MYTPNRGKTLDQMLQRIGAGSVDELFADIPEQLRLKGALDLPGPLPEWELMRSLRDLAERNSPVGRMVSFLGGGCYDHYIPAAVRHLLNRSEFATAYTPYQPEVSQGTLQAIFEFQTYMARLTGMDVANASMYDGVLAGKADVIPGLAEELKAFLELSGLRFPALAVSAATGQGLGELGPRLFANLGVVRVYTKTPGHAPDKGRPYAIRRGQTVADVARLIHRDIEKSLRFARLWGPSGHDGQHVGPDHALADGDVIELHT